MKIRFGYQYQATVVFLSFFELPTCTVALTNFSNATVLENKKTLTRKPIRRNSFAYFAWNLSFQPLFCYWKMRSYRIFRDCLLWTERINSDGNIQIDTILARALSVLTAWPIKNIGNRHAFNFLFYFLLDIDWIPRKFIHIDFIVIIFKWWSNEKEFCKSSAQRHNHSENLMKFKTL